MHSRLDGHPYKLLATLRRDESPQVLGIEVELLETGDLRAGSMPDSGKARDLDRDGAAYHVAPPGRVDWRRKAHGDRLPDPRPAQRRPLLPPRLSRGPTVGVGTAAWPIAVWTPERGVGSWTRCRRSPGSWAVLARTPPAASANELRRPPRRHLRARSSPVSSSSARAGEPLPAPTGDHGRAALPAALSRPGDRVWARSGRSGDRRPPIHRAHPGHRPIRCGHRKGQGCRGRPHRLGPPGRPPGRGRGLRPPAP
jgi:hypothetical protein